MNAAPSTSQDRPPAWRRCALALHSVSAQDRQWLLSQLPPAQAGELEHMLEELRLLGIPAEPQLVRHALEPDECRGGHAARTVPAAANLLPSAELADILAAEPVSLVAQVIVLQPAVQREDILSSLPSTKRAAVRESLRQLDERGSGLPHGLEEALRRELAARMSAGPVVPSGLAHRLRMGLSRATGVFL